jgi:hypothetical protein
MIECMIMAAGGGDAFALACRHARRSTERRAEWPEFAPPVALSDGPLGAVQAADREIGRQTAVRARAVAHFAATRPASADRVQGEPGAMSPQRWAARPELLREVSEWAAQELVVALSISSEAAEALLTRSLTLVHRLPGTLAALEAGALHPGHVWPMLDKVAPIEDATVRAVVEADLLRWAAGRVTTPAQLGARARREVARRDARAAARRLEKAIQERGVDLRPGPADGLAALTAVLTEPEALSLYRALGAYADALEDDPDGRPRTRRQKMADCLLDLVLRPGETAGPPVQVLLTVVASMGTLAGGDEPGEVDGRVVSAEVIREVVRLFGPRSGLRPPEPCDVEDRTRRPGSARRETDQPPESRDADMPISGGGIDDSGAWGPAGRPDQPPWPQLEHEELERWWAEMERRVFAGELDTGPEPPFDIESLCVTSPDQGPPDWETRAPGPPDPGGPGQERSDQDRPDQQRSDPQRSDQERPRSTASANESRWWPAVDAALDDTARALREVDRALSRAGRSMRIALVEDAADEAAWQAGAGRFTEADDVLAVLRSCTDAQRAELADLLSATGGGGLVERPRIALTDALSGALIALTDLPEMRGAGTCGARACRRDPGRCSHDLTGRPGFGPPGPTDGYRPSTALDRWVRARDRRCRFPGCRRRVPRGGELDHDRPYPLGPTSVSNLTGYCTGHHRGKHQAAGWRHELAADGTLAVTTPTGLTAVTTPPPY